MLKNFTWFVFLIILVVCQTASLYNNFETREVNNQFDSLNSEQLAELDEYFSRKLDEELSSENNYITKRDTLWTTTEVLDCVRRLKLYKNASKLDLVTEMLNCYRRLKHVG